MAKNHKKLHEQAEQDNRLSMANSKMLEKYKAISGK